MCINLTVENWLTIISLLFIAISGCFIYFQWRKSLKTKRAEFINQIIEKLRFDEKMAKIMYIVDYNQNWYNYSFHGSNIEFDIDKLFSYINYICYLKFSDNISDDEFNILKYEVNRICISKSSQCYLWNLYHFAIKNQSTCSFPDLIDYGIKNNLLHKDFKTNTSLFTKTLNW